MLQTKPTYDMKKLILLLFIPLLFACSSDDEDNTNPVDDTNPVYLDANGVTIKARDWAVVGDQGTIDGVTYTIVSNATLGGDLTKVCTSRITNMGELFYQADTFNQDISSWDVSNVSDMNYMFYQAEAFNQDLSYWDVSNVTNMGAMFAGASSFDQDLSAWDVGGVDRCYVFCAGTNWSLPKPNFSNNCIEVSAAGTGVNFPDLGCNQFPYLIN